MIGRGGIWPGARSNFHENDVVSDGSHATRLNRSEFGYSSRHSNGVLLFLMCDGAVRNFHESMESNSDGTATLQKLAARNDGMVLGSF